jgi:AAA family ATP:ADP antiporter
VKPAPHHRGVVTWGALAVGLLVAQQVTGKATRDAFFLSHYPAAALPAVMIGASFVAVAAALGVGHLLAARAPREAVPALVAVNAALLLGQFVLAQSVPRLAAILVYLQVAATGGTLISGYWSVVSERFDPWTAKRVMSRVGLGASIGGVAGGLIAYAASGVVPVAAMLLLTAGLNVAALVCMVQFGGEGPVASTERSGEPSPLATLRSVPYLRLLALLVALGAGADTLLDYVLKSRASAALVSGPELLAFFAAFHAGIGLLALLSQTVLAAPALQRLGLAGTVALRPLAVAAASTAAILDVRLWSAVLCRGSHDVLSNSLFRSGYELLYTPLPEREKRATKQVVDVAFDKLGAIAGGAATFAAVRLVDDPERALLVLAGGLSLLALGLTRRLHQGYMATLEDGLRAGKVRLDPEALVDSTTRFTVLRARLPQAPALPTPPAASDRLQRSIADLRSLDALRIRRALSEPDPLDAGLVFHLMPLLARNDVYLDVLRALRKLAPRTTGQILDAILDPDADPAMRRRLPRVLKAVPTARAAEGLLHGLEDTSFAVRASCASTLLALVARSTELQVPANAIWTVVRNEIEGALASKSDRMSEGPDHQAIFDHVFRLLSLVLDRDPLKIAAWAIRGSDPTLKGTALEYLENVLPTELRNRFLRFVEAPGSVASRPHADVLKDLLRSGESFPGLRRQGLKPRD